MSTDVVSSATETHSATVDAPAAGDPRTSASVRTPLQQLTHRTRWLWARIESVLGKFAPISGVIPKTITGVDTAADKLTLAGHGLSSNDAVRLKTVAGGTVPGGLVEGDVYYVIPVDTDSFKLSATSGPGAAEDITGALSGSVYVVLCDGDPELYVQPSGGTVMRLAAGLTALAGQITSSITNLLAGNNTWDGVNTFDGGVAITTNPIVAGTGIHYSMSSRSVTRSSSSMFTRVSDGLAFAGSVAVPASDQANTVLNLPHGATVTKFTWGHDPNNASPPAGTKVVGAVYKRHLTTGALTLIVSTTDPTSGGSYGASHLFDSAAISEVIDRTTYVYLALLTGETGAGSDFTTWWGMTWTGTVTAIDDGVA